MAADQKQRSLSGEGFLCIGWFAGGCLPMRSQAARRNVGLVASATDERSLVVMQPLVQFEVNILRKSRRALVAGIRLVARMKSHVSFQIGC